MNKCEAWFWVILIVLVMLIVDLVICIFFLPGTKKTLCINLKSTFIGYEIGYSILGLILLLVWLIVILPQCWHYYINIFF